MSVSIILINKASEIKETEIKSFDVETLYKKAGFKTADGFAKQTEWGLEVEDTKYNIVLYAKTTGRAGQENKYEFPPPVDTTLFFGTCVLVNLVDGKPVDLFREEWSKIYETLYGGFEDIGDNDSESDDESEDADIPKTKEGYTKDGFIVDDDYSDESEAELTDSSDEIVVKTSAKLQVSSGKTRLENTVISATIPNKPVTRSTASKKSKSNCKVEQVDTNKYSYLNCENELELEDYV